MQPVFYCQQECFCSQTKQQSDTHSLRTTLGGELKIVSAHTAATRRLRKSKTFLNTMVVFLFSFSFLCAAQQCAVKTPITMLKFVAESVDWEPGIEQQSLPCEQGQHF